MGTKWGRSGSWSRSTVTWQDLLSGFARHLLGRLRRRIEQARVLELVAEAEEGELLEEGCEWLGDVDATGVEGVCVRHIRPSTPRSEG